MHRHLLFSLLLAALFAGGAPGLRAQPQPRPLAGLSRAEIQAVMQDTVRPSYATDGSARSDTARRLATAGAWEIEGGDMRRGLRLVEAAWRLGVSDSVFYRDMMAVTRLLRCPAEAVLAAEEARRRWPGAPWTDSAYTHAVAVRAQTTPGALRRKCPLRLQGIVSTP